MSKNKMGGNENPGSIESFYLILYMKMRLYDPYQTSFHSIK
jgi:hypothetical protein